MRPPIHPGEFLRREIIVPEGTSLEEAALILRVSPGDVRALLKSRLRVGSDLASRLAEATGTLPQSWLALQTSRDRWESEQSGSDGRGKRSPQ